MTADNTPRNEFIEVMALSDVFAIGVAPPERKMDYIRLVFWADGTDADRVVVAKIVIPASAYNAMCNMLLEKPTHMHG